MTPEDEPVDIGLDEEKPRSSGPVGEEPIIVDLDQSVFEVLRRVETTMDPSTWIRAAVEEKAERDDRAGRDVRARLTKLLAEMVRIVDLEQEFAGPEALGRLNALADRLREVEVLVDKLGSIFEGRVKQQPSGGPWHFGTSAYSSLSDWPGGGVVGIHGTNQPGLIPGRPSHGCIRVPNPKIRQLARLMPIGTPVSIIN